MPFDSSMTKIVWQYSEALPEETMTFLRGIAADCCKVKNFVYERYSGIKKLSSLTRRYLTQPKTDAVDGYRISPNGYSYKDGAIPIVCRIPRKRITIPLENDRTFERQIQVHIKENFIALAVPIEAKIKKHKDDTNTVSIHIGNQDMFTLSNEHVYGVSLAELTNPETERLAKKNRERSRIYTAYRQNAESGNRQKAEKIERNNLGRQKYDSQKEKEKRRTTNFINAEINRMFRLEKTA